MAYLCMRILLSLLCLCSASEAIQCSGFSIEPPAGWKISCEGDDLGGGLNASGASGSFSLSWIQNPGLEPDEILDLVESAYESGDSSVLSSRRGRLAVEGGEAVVLDLAYSIWGKQAQRSFAAWSSGRSDRIFLLSERSDGTGMLQSIVSSFRDLATTEHLAMGPLPESGPWPALLQDLLRSYHYADPGELSAARAHLAVRHNLIPDNGSLVVESSESLWSEPSQKALARARAVVQLSLIHI
ncbi:MAG: hypothetical protein QUS08_10430 [Methanothrix sp.]|nr:hypothetical protein [Methanothrix sp.]